MSKFEKKSDRLSHLTQSNKQQSTVRPLSDSIPVGEDILIQCPTLESTEQSEINHASCFIGFVAGKFLILQTPDPKENPFTISSGTPLVLRYMFEDRLTGCRVVCLNTTNKPIPMLFTSYPSAIDHLSLRGAKRLRVSVALTINGTSNPNDRLQNLSRTGALLRITDVVLLGETLRLTFELPDGTQIRNLPATVQRVNMGTKRGEVGVRFSVEHPALDRLNVYLKIAFETLGVKRN